MSDSKNHSRHGSVPSQRETPPPMYTVESPLASHPPTFVIQKPEPVASSHSASSSFSSTTSSSTMETPPTAVMSGKNFSRPPLSIHTGSPPRMFNPPKRQSSLVPSVASSVPSYSSMHSYSSRSSQPGHARPVSYVPPSDGRPRKDIPYDSPMLDEHPLPPPPVQYQGYLNAPGMQFSAQNRRTTVYFDPKRTNRESYMSYDSRIEKRRGIDDEEDETGAGKKTSRWRNPFAWCFPCAAARK